MLRAFLIFFRSVPSIVADTSPLVALSAVNRVDLLANVFDQVIVPCAVYDEIVTQGEGWIAAESAQACLRENTWMQVREVPQSPLLDELRSRLGAGEAEVIALASDSDCVALIDDRKARRIGEGLNLHVIGTFGVLARNKLEGRIAVVRPLIEGMRSAGIYFSDDLVKHFLRGVGEA